MTGSSIVSPELRARVRGLAIPVASVLGRLGLTPNHLTVIGFAIAVVAGFAAALQLWLAAGLLVLFGAAFDLFDGALARATATTSRFGAFLDSTLDRWGEGVVYVGLAWGSVVAGFEAGAVLAVAAMCSAFMVSYVRAKGESLGFPAGGGLANVGLAPREVRIAILTVGLVAVGLAGPVGPWSVACPDGLATCPAPDAYHPGDLALGIALGLIAVLATVTTIQRILHVRAQAKEG